MVETIHDSNNYSVCKRHQPNSLWVYSGMLDR